MGVNGFAVGTLAWLFGSSEPLNTGWVAGVQADESDVHVVAVLLYIEVGDNAIVADIPVWRDVPVTNRDLCNEVKLEFGASERDLDLRNEVKLALRVMGVWNVLGRTVKLPSGRMTHAWIKPCGHGWMAFKSLDRPR